MKAALRGLWRARSVSAVIGWMIGIIAMTITSAVSADILYNTTTMTDNQTYTGTPLTNCYVGGAANSGGTMFDHQIADDFMLTDTYHITSVTADFLCPLPTPPVTPAGGVRVEIFQDNGTGHPINFNAGSPTAQFIVSGASLVATTFSNIASTATYGTTGIRFTLDLSGLDIILGSGRWWLSVQPVDETPTGEIYRQVSTAGTAFGLAAHRRRGGIAHGNSYSGTGPTDGTWEVFTGSGRDLAMMVQGDLVPGPSALALFGIAAFGCSRRRRA